MKITGQAIYMNPKVDAFLNRAKKWQEEMTKLRAILLETSLEEDLKWGKPSYSFQGKNIAIIQPFKEYCAVMYFKGALLQDSNGILDTPGQHQSGRQIRFKTLSQLNELEPIIKEYVQEAIEIEKSGKKVQLKRTEEYEIPDELQDKLDEFPALKTAFESLTPGRQRNYIFYISQAKQSKTREERVKKYIPKILEGKGMND